MWLRSVSVYVKSTGERTDVYRAMERNAVKMQLTSTVCCLMTRSGIVARSFCQIWMPMNTLMINPKPRRDFPRPWSSSKGIPIHPIATREASTQWSK
jgi:hypothetical protein